MKGVKYMKVIDGNSAFFYLYRKTFKNRVKRAVKKPVTYIYMAFVIWYLYFIFQNFGQVFQLFEMEKNSVLTALLTVLVFFIVPSNMISYSKRKGLIFREPDVHFLFSAPIAPKRILLYAHLKTMWMALFLNLVVTIGIVAWFEMPVWKAAVYFIYSFIVENILETCLMVLCYGNERLDEEQMKRVQLLMYLLIGIFVLIGILVYMKDGAGFEAVVDYLHSPAIRLVPIIGWNIAFLHLLFMAPDTVSIIGSILYFGAVVILFFAALRMKCTGEYFEDAMKFAEDYEEARKKGKAGEMAIIGKKKKYGKAAVAYKGGYGKAIFYRQLLEYKKNRFFIFGFYTLVCLCVGIGIGVFGYKEKFGGYGEFVILGVMAYLTFLFSGYSGKWGKELKKPYTYLIPDTALCKLWYATLMEHIRALVDGCLIALPAGILLGISVIRILLIIGVYICIQACKLYAEVMVEAFLGNILGTAGKQYARVFFLGIVIMVGIMGAAAGTMIYSVEAGLLFLIGIVILMTGGMMAIAAVNFERMETVV